MKFEPVMKESAGFFVSSESRHHCFSRAVKNDLILKLSEEGTHSTDYLAYPCTLYHALVSKASHLFVWTVSIHEGTNGNGGLLCEFAYANNMVVMSTDFQHIRIHKVTWLSPIKTQVVKLII